MSEEVMYTHTTHIHTCVSKHATHASLCQDQIILNRMIDYSGGMLQFTRIAHITRYVTFIPG